MVVQSHDTPRSADLCSTSASSEFRLGLDGTAVENAPPVPSSPSPEFLRLVPREFARRHLVLSAGCVEEDGRTVERLLVSDTPPRTRPHVAFNVGVRLGRPVRTLPAPAETLAAAIDPAYASALEVYPRHLQATEGLVRLQVRSGRTDDRTLAMLDDVALRGEDQRWREWAVQQRLRLSAHGSPQQ